MKLLSVVFPILLIALATTLAARLKRAGAVPIGQTSDFTSDSNTVQTQLSLPGNNQGAPELIP